MRTSSDRGIAMVAVLLVMLLVSALMVGFTAVVMSDQRFRGLDRDHTAAFYAAHAGLEKLTTDLGNLFFVTVAPTVAQLIALVEPYHVDVTARTSGGGEVHLQREVHAVAIPVFQFGYFSHVDLSFFA